MTNQEVVELVFGAIEEIRRSQRPWGTIHIVVDKGFPKFVTVEKVPSYRMVNGDIEPVQLYKKVDSE